jgi:hypothetical protein
MIQVEVFCVTIPYSDVIGYQRFEEPRCLHPHFTLRMEEARSSEKLMSYRNRFLIRMSDQI